MSNFQKRLDAGVDVEGVFQDIIAGMRGLYELMYCSVRTGR